MADDARNALFGGAASRNTGKVNPYANIGNPSASSTTTINTANFDNNFDIPTDSSSSSAPPKSSTATTRSKPDSTTVDDDPNRNLLLAGGKKKPEHTNNTAPVNDDEIPKTTMEAVMFEGDLEFDFQDLNLTAGATYGGSSNLNGGFTETSDNMLDFEILDNDLARFEQDELVKDALQRGVDLRVYSKQVDHELRQMEMLSIADYIKESDHIASLFDQIVSCEGVLSTMQNLLTGFQNNLGGISAEIRSLQEESLALSIRMQNRKNVGAKIKTFLSKVAVPETLIEKILEGEINELWLRDLRQLAEKIDFINGTFRNRQHGHSSSSSSTTLSVVPLPGSDDASGAFTDSLSDLKVNPFETPSANQSVPVIRNLQLKATARVRDFLAKAIGELTKPKTNMQKQQEYILLKYAYAMAFLNEHGIDKERGTDAGKEIRGMYIREVGTWYADIFKKYTEDLAKAALPYANKGDIVGNFDTTSPGAYASSAGSSVRPPDPFAIGDRYTLLADLFTAPVLQPHVLHAEKTRLPFETLYRSVIRHLADVAVAEETFCRKFFGEVYSKEVYGQTLSKAIAACVAALDDHLNMSFDAPGLLLIVALISTQWNALSSRNSSCLDGFCIRAAETTRKRFRTVFDANVTSIKAAATAPKKLGGIDPAPHPVTRRFADWCGSILVLHRAITHPSAVDQMLPSHLTAVTKEMENLWSKMGAELAKGLPRVAFTLAQYTYLLSVYNERGVNAEDTVSLTEAYNKALAAYVDEAVDTHFRVFTGWVKKVESNALSAAKSKNVNFVPGIVGPGGVPVYLPPESSGITITAESAEAETIIRDFALNWRSGLSALNDDVNRFFGREGKTGPAVLMAVFQKAAEYHNRFTAALARAFPTNPPFIREVVSLQTVYAEMRRYARS